MLDKFLPGENVKVNGLLWQICVPVLVCTFLTFIVVTLLQDGKDLGPTNRFNNATCLRLFQARTWKLAEMWKFQKILYNLLLFQACMWSFLEEANMFRFFCIPIGDSVIDIWILITSLVSSNSSYQKGKVGIQLFNPKVLFLLIVFLNY
jgi:hypothetical protein